MKLIELIRKAREEGYRFIAIDKSNGAYAYMVYPVERSVSFSTVGNRYTWLGNYNLSCDWKDSLIDINQLQGVK